MAKAKALYVCKIIAVPTGFLQKLVNIIANAARQAMRMPKQQGSRYQIHAPTFMKGIRIKSMEEHYNEAVLFTFFKLLQSRDRRIREIIRIRVLQFLEDMNTSLLELFEELANHEPKVFFDARAEVTYKTIDDDTNEKETHWQLLPRDEMRPRLKLEKGRTLMAVLYQQSRKYQLAITLDTWMFYNGQRWTQLTSDRDPKKILRAKYLSKMGSNLSKENHWADFKPEQATSTKSYRWSRQLPSTKAPCLPKQTMILGYQALLGVLPFKCNKIRNRERNDPLCVMVKMVRIMTARHDKVVQELALWGEIAKSKGKIISVTTNLRLNTETRKIPDLVFVYNRSNQTIHTFIEVTISMDNATKRARERKDRNIGKL